jgi:hypothetical protein
MSSKYFIVLSGNNVQVRTAVSVERMYEQVAFSLREEDVHGVAIPMSASRLAPGVWVQFQIPGVGEFTCWEEAVAHTWDNGPTGEWRKKIILAHYGAWGDWESMEILREAVRVEFGGDLPDWLPSDEDDYNENDDSE